MKKTGLLLLLLILAPFSLALGVGSATLHSAIGEKLHLEMPLLGADNLTNEELLLGIAGSREYQAMNIVREPFHHALRFTIARDNSGNATLLITSTQPVSEPYLHFVLQVTTPGKTLIKDIAVLLDTPNL